jgi:hypothetical protein
VEEELLASSKEVKKLYNPDDRTSLGLDPMKKCCKSPQKLYNFQQCTGNGVVFFGMAVKRVLL